MPTSLDLLDAFKERHSVRIFQDKPLTQDQKDIIRIVIAEANSLEIPFHSIGIEVSFTDPGLGNPSVIRNEAGFIVCKIPSGTAIEKTTIVDLCYIAHHVMMRIAQNRINTI